MPKPDPPAVIPAYIRDGVQRQDAETLRALSTWAEQLAAWQEQDVDRKDVEEDVEDNEELDAVDEDASGSGTIVEKKVPCGKDSCSQCPHGPYRYRVSRDGDSIIWEYLGKP